jgi:hypothetical protein
MSYISSSDSEGSLSGFGCGGNCGCAPCKSGINGLDEWYMRDIPNQVSGSEIEGFGDPTPLWKRVEPERVRQVVQAIYRLPEGTSPVKPRDYSYEQLIVKKLRDQGFSADEIEAGLVLTREELGLPGNTLQVNPNLLNPNRDRSPRIGPAEYSQKEYDRALAKHLDELYARAQMGDDGAAEQLMKAINRLLNDRRRMQDVGRQLREMRSPAAITLRVPPEPAAPTPSPPRRWWVPPRVPVRR